MSSRQRTQTYGSGKQAFVAPLPFKNFYEAEEYYQDYYLKNPEAFEEEIKKSGRNFPE